MKICSRSQTLYERAQNVLAGSPGNSASSAVYNLGGMQTFEGAKYARLLRGMQERGVRLIGRGLWYISGAHTAEDVDRAVAASRDTLDGTAREA